MSKQDEKDTSKKGSRIIPCHCQHAGQDAIHGKTRRVHNLSAKTKGYRCTVCGSMK